MADPLAYSRIEAAAAIGVGLTTFVERVQPALRVVRLGRKVLIPATELTRWLEEHAERPMVDQVTPSREDASHDPD